MIGTLKKALRQTFLILSGKRRISQSYNLFKYRISKKKEILNYKPIYLTILPVHRCNLSCKMCLTHSEEFKNNPWWHKPFDDMSFDTFVDITKRFKEALAVGFMGNGEPLLNKDIYKMIDYAESKAKMHTALNSNGILLDKHIDRLLESSLSEIDISINGHSEEEFARMTAMQPSFFTKIIDSLKLLIQERNKRDSKLVICVSLIVDKTNIHYIQDMVDFTAALGSDKAVFNNILPLVRKKAKEISLYDDDKTLGILRNIKIPETKTKIELPVPLDGRTDNSICKDFFISMNIDGALNVGGCPRQRFNQENNGKYSDKDVWNNGYFKSERRKFLDGDIELHEPCTVCFANSQYMNDSMQSYLKKN